MEVYFNTSYELEVMTGSKSNAVINMHVKRAKSKANVCLAADFDVRYRRDEFAFVWCMHFCFFSLSGRVLAFCL